MTMLYAPAEKNEGAGGQGEEAPSDGDIYGNKGVKIPTKEELDARPDDEPDGDELAKRELEGEDGEEKADFTEDEGEYNEGEESEEGQEEGEQEEGEEVEKKEPTFLRIHPDDLKKVASPVGQQQEEKMTPEQLRAAFNPVEVTEDTLKALGFAEPTREQVKGFQEFANATVKNAVSIARLLIQKETKRFEQAVVPLQGYYQEQQRNQAFQRFYTQHKDLAKFPQIVKIALNEVEPTNPDGSPMSEQQLFKAVAVASRKQLQNLGVKINQPNANHSAGNGKPVPKANKFSSPGRSGGDQRSNNTRQNNPDADIYVGR